MSIRSTVATCPKTARVVLAAAAYRWSSDFLPLESSEINPATQADAAAGNFARGSYYYIEFSIPTAHVPWPIFCAVASWANSIADAFDTLLLRFLLSMDASLV
jgi:hypothetical protein